MAGLAFITDTVVLIISAIWGSAVIKPLMVWYYSFPWGANSAIDAGMIWWIWPVYYGMLIAMWFALLIAMYYMSIQKVDYGYGSY
jgi:hypothetical protein